MARGLEVPPCALKIEGGSLFAHRAGGTTYATHSLELKVKEKLSNV